MEREGERKLGCLLRVVDGVELCLADVLCEKCGRALGMVI